MAILVASDFSGQFKLAQNQYTDLAPYIERYEREYLVKLLGAELYGLFYDDLSNDTSQVPLSQKYIDIFDPFQFDDCGVVISHGIKFLLKGVIFYHYIKENNLYHTIAGVVSNHVENSDSQAVTTAGAQYITGKYADCLETYDAIQQYIGDHASDYPDFNGTSINRSHVFW